MADPKRRRLRIREGFPPVYDTRPRGSALGELLDTLADALTELDTETEALLRERWLRLARERAPLEQLARLVGTLPLPDEPAESFRQRTLIQARILRSGLASPRAVIALAASALGLELCPKLEPLPSEGGARAQAGYGLLPGSLDRCGAACGRGEVCPVQARRRAQLLLIDNPPDPRRVELLSAGVDDTLTVQNDSLEVATPTVRIRATDDKLRWPAIFHEEETIFYAGHLLPGQTLVIVPSTAPGEHLGRAFVEDADGVTDVRADVHYFTNSVRFAPDDAGPEDDASRFAPDASAPEADVTRFARFGEAELRTPILNRGATRWRTGLITRAWLVDILGEAESEARFGADIPRRLDRDARMDLQLDWLAYPPCSFQLRVPRNAWVRQVEAWGALRLVQEMVELARPAGVRASVDFPQDHQLADEGSGGAEGSWGLRVQPTFSEPQPVAEAHQIELSGSWTEPHPELRDRWTDAVDGGTWTPIFAGLFADEGAPPTVGTRFNLSRFPLTEDTDD